MEKGATLEECLECYPILANDLRPLLQTAMFAKASGTSPVPGNAMTRGRARVLSHATRLRTRSRPYPIFSGAFRIASVSLALLVFLLMVGNGLISASAEALPGDTLYQIKRTVESIRLGLALSAESESLIEQEITNRRIDETEELLVNLRVEEVEFEGTIDQQLSNGWIIEGIPVVITDQTTVKGIIAEGVFVEVRGITQTDGSVLASRIQVEFTDEASDDPSADPGDTPDEEDQSTSQPTESESDSSGKGSDDSDKGGDSDPKNETPEPTAEEDNS
jgi:hypothetical protein